VGHALAQVLAQFEAQDELYARSPEITNRRGAGKVDTFESKGDNGADR
jgi:hypothetical protein